MPIDKPYFIVTKFDEIIEKFVEPEKPYIKEQPYKSKPEERALNTKYFKPASEDLVLFLLNDANTYRARDCSSSPI